MDQNKSIDSVVNTGWNYNDTCDSIIIGGIGVAAFNPAIGGGITLAGMILKGHAYYRNRTKPKEDIRFESVYPTDDWHYDRDSNINPN